MSITSTTEQKRMQENEARGKIKTHTTLSSAEGERAGMNYFNLIFFYRQGRFASSFYTMKKKHQQEDDESNLIIKEPSH